MNADIAAAAAFMATHARMLDRRRFGLLIGDTDPTAVLAALNAYRNPGGGYGWGLEPDLRSPESQPGAALHAFEVFEDLILSRGGASEPGTGYERGRPAGGASGHDAVTGGDAGGAAEQSAPAAMPAPTVRDAVALCDWLESVSLPEGGLPFALPVTDPAGCSPWWVGADPSVSSLQITAIVAAIANRVAAHEPAIAGHPWLATANDYCLAAIQAIDEAPHALVLAFAVQFLDAVHDTRPEAAALLDGLGRYLPPNGLVRVEGGTDDEMMRPLDFAPAPGRPARALVTPEAVSAELRRLAAGQRDDGGWTVEYAHYSPAAALDWRGHSTVRAVSILRCNGLL